MFGISGVWFGFGSESFNVHNNEGPRGAQRPGETKHAKKTKNKEGITNNLKNTLYKPKKPIKPKKNKPTLLGEGGYPNSGVFSTPLAF